MKLKSLKSFVEKFKYDEELIPDNTMLALTEEQNTFGVTFKWNGTEKTVSLVNGEDVFVLAGMFEKLLKDYGIEYKSEINIR